MLFLTPSSTTNWTTGVKRVFKRFYRGGSELERTTKGTGLGLFIVKSLVSKMKGKIHVHGRGPLRGATFEVELPGQALPPVPLPTVPSAVEANLECSDPHVPGLPTVSEPVTNTA